MIRTETHMQPMDPNANLREQITLCKVIRTQRTAGKSSCAEESRLDALTRAYSEWRAFGGFPAEGLLASAAAANRASLRAWVSK